MYRALSNQIFGMICFYKKYASLRVSFSFNLDIVFNVVLDVEIMSKFERRFAKSLDSIFKLFKRMLVVKKLCDNRNTVVRVNGILAKAINSTTS